MKTGLAAIAQKSPLAVAYSGGADSTALLLMALEVAPGRVSALHVHHGLQAAADDFAEHCEAFCLQRDVPLTVLRVNAKPLVDRARRMRLAKHVTQPFLSIF